MAYLREAAGFGGQSGVLGNVVLAQTEAGTVMRARPLGSRRRSEAQAAGDRRMHFVHLAWEALDDEAAQAWRTYALERAAASPRGSRQRMTSAWSHFSGLGMKYLQVHGGHTVPSLPPAGAFTGDGLRITVAGGEGSLLYSADGSNRQGVLTEVLAQRLNGRHNAARPKSYASQGFVAFEGPQRVEVPVGHGRYWACAVRFVEAATGRMTDLVEIGRATVQ